ncbi:MutT/nudix family protein [Methylocaldum marinum]|uniref:Phosphatase NudJ n=1 Tax=Methylocaldum marinum TaxID=1432792 RepID=A0A250L005_9GAMM|nr:NUDIX hydrolase [Methylocaldum marinum]BBA37263.1 MutT/nudix family protein [Methylocaldum marinum]
MHQLETQSGRNERPRVTVAAIVEREARFLVVEEQADNGELVINQPAGHVEAGESVIEAAIRETFEETAWRFTPEALVGIYLWRRATGDASFLRIGIVGSVDGHDPHSPLDEGIVRSLWLTREELLSEQKRLRSPLVMKCIDDYLKGERYPLSMLKSLLS